MNVINICFHGIGTPRRDLETDEAGYWIPESLYLQIVDEIAGRDDIAVSFDDGNVSDLEIGLRPLLQTDRSATFFVLAGRLDQPGSLSPDEVRTLHRQGMKIGSHGMDHVPWRHLSEREEERELTEARSVISDVVGLPITDAALPLGRYDRRTLGALRARGYQRVFSSDRRRARPTSWLQARYSVHSGDSIESIRTEILKPPSFGEKSVGSLKGLIKRFR